MENEKSVTQASADAMPTLHDYDTGAELRPATAEEHRASVRAVLPRRVMASSSPSARLLRALVSVRDPEALARVRAARKALAG